ncbi:type II toxin-antitoxin system HicB family antitoxin [Dethiobacter alkaliphilus]|uniref:type II toxin-antitoxin system HicB family antitoxin n=1 Tax=Dethiobacter alkaliphilus TaxID=427926 RepID=UPI002226F4EA|nr:type II toxin-antitoxin system HicB family antitoxin [Dethiobacter alkaliphilus]MCW3490036.1 type II toxin-antitoxin system HicB family antitoxin [Dethiobacter alkaliphilus]
MKEEFRLIYPAVCYVKEDSIRVEFPDLPGLVSVCNENSLTKAVLQAQAELMLHVANLLDGNDLIPEPTPINRVRYQQPKDGEIVTMVNLEITPLAATPV